MDAEDEPTVPRHVLAAFGLVGLQQRLTGGMGTSVLVGSAVLKPVGDDPEAPWLADLLSALRPHGIRTPEPIAAVDGRWVVDGWVATVHLPGHEEPGRWAETIVAGRRLHEALRKEARPDLLPHRDNRWATADRVSWNEDEPTPGSFADELMRHVVPTDLPSQLVHCDLAGNVLFHPTEPPAVIDLSLYWRPRAYAEAIVVIDALLWYGADDDVIDLVEPRDMLLRALVFRWVTEQATDHRGDRTPLAVWERVAALVLDRSA